MRMTDVFPGVYAWADAHSGEILLAGLLLPVSVIVPARLFRAGRAATPGRAVTRWLVGVSLALVVCAVLLLTGAAAVLGMRPGEFNVQLVFAPLLCLLISLVGVRWAFPPSPLASAGTLKEVSGFFAAGLCGVWLFSLLRGFGVLVVLGGLSELIAFGLLLRVLLRRLWQRAQSSSHEPA